MDLRQLKYFVAVAKARNFTRASELLHIAQPALSRQIQLLEASLGVQLISRSSRPMQLTEAGRVFYEQSIQLLGRIEQIKTSTRRIGLAQRRAISLGYVASTLYGELPMLMRKLRQHAPDTDIQLIDLTSIQQIDALKSGRIDIGFGRVRSNDDSVERIILREERLVLAVPLSSPLALTADAVSLREISSEKLIVYPKEPRPSFADDVLSLLHDRGVRPTEVLEVRELQAALGLVAGEVGVCLIPASARFRSDVHYRLIDDERVTSPIILSHRRNDSAEYIQTIKQLIQEMYAERPSWLEL